MDVAETTTAQSYQLKLKDEFYEEVSDDIGFSDDGKIIWAQLLKC